MRSVIVSRTETAEPGETALVAKLRAGEPAAVGDAFDRYNSRLFGFVLRMSGNRQTAEDMVQETFVRLAKSGPRLREDTDLRAWLFTVARNLLRSHRRWAAVDADRLEILAEAPRPIQATAHDQLAEREAAKRLEVAISRLADKYREIILLVGVQQMSPAEAASVIGTTPAAARKRLSRARALLRKELE